MIRRFTVCCSLLISNLVVQNLSAQVPAIVAVSPQAVTPGAATKIRISGGNLAAPTRFWMSFPGEAILAPDVPENGKNAAEVTYQITIPADASPGLHGIRIATATGVSNLQLIAIDDLPSAADVRPNTTFATAQPISLPTAIDGRVDSLGRHYFKFTVAAGQRLSFDVLARRFGSPLDPMIRILDAAGKELSFADDSIGLGGDSRLSYIFATAGEYVLELRDIRFQGGGNFNYRLRIGDFPLLNTPYPMSVTKGKPSKISFAGISLEGVAERDILIPVEWELPFINVSAKSATGNASGFAPLGVSSTEELLEAEPNEDGPTATRVGLGASLNGRLDKKGDIDHFVFTATQGQRFFFRSVTRQQGSPADLFVRIVKPDGGDLVSSDDVGNNDALLDFNCPANGDYLVIVRDLNRRGGTEFAYRLECTPYADSFEIDATTDTLNLPLNGTAVITVNSARVGYNGPIELSVEGAAGVSGSCVIGPGLNTTLMTIENKGLAAGELAQVRIVGSAKIGDRDVRVFASLMGARRAALNNMPIAPLAVAETLGAASNAQPFFVFETEPRTISLPRTKSASVKIKAIRAADFLDQIVLAINPPQNGIPAGVTAAIKPIEKDQTEVEIVFSANDQAPLGPFTVLLNGTGKRGEETIIQHAPAIRLEIVQP